MKLLWTALVAVVLCAAALPLVEAATSTVRLKYAGAAPLGAGAVDEECSEDLPASLGIVCLAIPKGRSTLSMEVKDASKLWVGGSYYVYDANEELIALGSHCSELTVPVAAGGLVVVRMELVNGPLACLAEGKQYNGEATKGVAIFTIS